MRYLAEYCAMGTVSGDRRQVFVHCPSLGVGEWMDETRPYRIANINFYHKFFVAHYKVGVKMANTSHYNSWPSNYLNRTLMPCVLLLNEECNYEETTTD